MKTYSYLALAVFFVIIDRVTPVIFPVPNNEDADFWYEHGKVELAKAEAWAYSLGQREFRRPKNIIIFVGDGMSLSTVTAARILKGQTQYGFSGEETQLLWERFPSLSLIKTYNVDRQVPDSAATASAMFTGVKTNFKTLGFDNSIKSGDPQSQVEARKVDSILTWAQQAGMKTGLVTNSRLTHGTPAALYAHTAHRYWECDAKIPEHHLEGVLDIGSQLVGSSPGLKTNVMFGGGDRALRNPDHSPPEKWSCVRQDGRDLIQEWMSHLEKEKASHRFVSDRESLLGIQKQDNLDHVLGVFAPKHMDYEDKRDNSSSGQPSLKEMTLKAIEVLENNDKGYFLMVENGQIDRAHHEGQANRAMAEVLVLEQVIEATLEQVDLEETLVIVTADHGHTLSISGYPPRGNQIGGLIPNDPLRMKDTYPYTALNYANGPGYVNAFNKNGERVDLSETDTNDMDFLHPSLIPMGSGVHSGHDVGLWATGPMSYFFHTTHEQSYIGHVMAYAICSGPYNQTCRRHLDRLKAIEMRSIDVNESSRLQLPSTFTVFTVVVLLFQDRIHTFR
ncbi:hypothetical protein TCAL_07551 [Tigriopus californicus]|uniref:alkaline phosphatase n=1 Tax=Tigriopus californicus TaxID=6832 RepID=A0A553PP45_TIGCA|nr:alkaline phosphatase-like [Tigriopus californicus]TRY79446.1 hypothetical protein TCAL_07551 [Tigriopus californicus]|eukprot:TCALIF_07551-PA protein Name:"Similar to ALPP Alkaline phosphatase, placental type (Homo sapiens)" AED:0.07 eAED:0.07 QI:196/1/1/1/1/1/9/11/561